MHRCAVVLGVLAGLVHRASSGLLKVGTPLPWAGALPHLKYVREHGILQFIETWKAVEGRQCDGLRWGDEVEYGILKLQGEGAERRVEIALRGQEVQDALNLKEAEMHTRMDGCIWHNEYGSWMIEGTPRDPYSGYVSDLLQVEANMRRRRRRLLADLRPGEVAPTMTCLPTMGAKPMEGAGGPVANSRYLSDDVINPHPRFAALTQNIRTRRGSNVDIRLPLFRDVKTTEATFDSAGLNGPPACPEGGPEVHMDAMAFGMGCTCLQVTFQAANLEESRFLHDQLLVLGPVMLALSAASPAFRGRLVDTDTRWPVISMAVDDRTEAERAPATATGSDDAGPSPQTDAEKEMAGYGRTPLAKSRYASSSRFIYGCELPQALNDLDVPIPEDHRETLVAAGVDGDIADHVAMLFNRDPLVIFEGSVDEVDDEASTEHFDNLQSTNWNSVRWKPPPRDGALGWRVEFRTLENQLTDFENAAFATFVVLLTRAILLFDLNFYAPLSKVEENFERAYKRDAVRTESFHWRMHLAPPEAIASAAERDEAPRTGPYWWKSILCSADAPNAVASQPGDPINELEEMTLSEIMSGKGDYFPGLVPLCRAYLDVVGTDADTRRRLDLYLELVALRAEGALPTAAKWARDFVDAHPQYRKDGVVNDAVCHDWVVAASAVGAGSAVGGHLEALLGPLAKHVTPLETAKVSDAALSGSENRVEATKRNEILSNYTKRPKFRPLPVS